jgi:hypothetical protein
VKCEHQFETEQRLNLVQKYMVEAWHARGQKFKFSSPFGHKADDAVLAALNSSNFADSLRACLAEKINSSTRQAGAGRHQGRIAAACCRHPSISPVTIVSEFGAAVYYRAMIPTEVTECIA